MNNIVYIKLGILMEGRLSNHRVRFFHLSVQKVKVYPTPSDLHTPRVMWVCSLVYLAEM